VLVYLLNLTFQYSTWLYDDSVKGIKDEVEYPAGLNLEWRSRNCVRCPRVLLTLLDSGYRVFHWRILHLRWVSHPNENSTNGSYQFSLNLWISLFAIPTTCLNSKSALCPQFVLCVAYGYHIKHRLFSVPFVFCQGDALCLL